LRVSVQNVLQLGGCADILRPLIWSYVSGDFVMDSAKEQQVYITLYANLGPSCPSGTSQLNQTMQEHSCNECIQACLSSFLCFMLNVNCLCQVLLYHYQQAHAYVFTYQSMHNDPNTSFFLGGGDHDFKEKCMSRYTFRGTK
jgi:hypothetical protein